MNPLYFLTVISLMFILSCDGQTSSAPIVEKKVGGPCQGCEAIFEYGNKELKNIDTLPEFHIQKPQLKLTGTVYQLDGRTPAEGIIIYIYHTNLEGIYPKKGTEKGYAQRHGYLRGWVKTNKDGRYTFYTFRPGPYPNRKTPEHVHITIKEPNKTEYYIEDFYFSDDPLLTKSEKEKLQNRGGSGICDCIVTNKQLVCERDIILGLNIPNY